MTNLEGKRKLSLRPWNLRKGDVIEYDDGYATVDDRPFADRNYFSGERLWRVYVDRVDSYLGRRQYVTFYRTDYSRHGQPTRVTVWR